MLRISPDWMRLLPALITLTFLTGLVGVTIITSGGDPLSLARIGTRFWEGDINGSEGYDGQFDYYIAVNPEPAAVISHLDAPSYRYQRILLPLIVRLLSAGNARIIPWIFPLVTILAHFVGTWSVTQLLSSWKANYWYALTYGLWVGFALSARLDLPETLAFGLVALAFYSIEKDRHFLSALALSAAIFSKEVTIPFMGAILLVYLSKRAWRNMIFITLVAILPYLIFQVWLYKTFGNFGIASGGAMATPFELFPFMGLFRIWRYSPIYGWMMLIVFLPCMIGPAIWGVVVAFRQLLKYSVDGIVLAALFNCLVIFFLPFSTYRETGGLLRMSCGVILAVLLLAAKYRHTRILNYSFMLIAYNAFLLK